MLLVNAYQDLSEVIEMCNEAQPLLNKLLDESKIESGPETVELSFDWSQAVVIAELVRMASVNSASRLAAHLEVDA